MERRVYVCVSVHDGSCTVCDIKTVHLHSDASLILCQNNPVFFFVINVTQSPPLVLYLNMGVGGGDTQGGVYQQMAENVREDLIGHHISEQGASYPIQINFSKSELG